MCINLTLAIHAQALDWFTQFKDFRSTLLLHACLCVYIYKYLFDIWMCSLNEYIYIYTYTHTHIHTHIFMLQCKFFFINCCHSALYLFFCIFQYSYCRAVAGKSRMKLCMYTTILLSCFDISMLVQGLESWIRDRGEWGGYCMYVVPCVCIYVCVCVLWFKWAQTSAIYCICMYVCLCVYMNVYPAHKL